MANEKILNSRLLLKYDSYENWVDNNPKLLAGEAAVAVVNTTRPDGQGGYISVPTCLMKIGNGTDFFNDLNWTAAQAADVYEWAKKATPDWADFGAIPADKLPEIPEELLPEIPVELLPEITASGDNEITLTASEHTVTAEHTEHAAGSAKTPSTASISGYGATGSIKVPKIVTNAAGHVTEISEETVTISIPAVVDTNTAHSHSAGNGLKLTGNGGINGDTKYELNLAFTLKDGDIILHEANDITKVIATLDAADLLEDSYLNDVEIEGNELKFTWKMDNGTTKTDSVDLTHLVDVYNGKDGTTVKINVNGYEIGAEVKENSLTNTHIASNAGIEETKLEQKTQSALALARTALQSHQDISGKKNIQTAVGNKITNKAHVLSNLTQNANGDISYDVKLLTPADIGAQAAGDYALKSELPVVNNGQFTVSGTGALTGTGSMTANQAGDTTANLDIAAKGVTTAKIADHAVGAHQTKACQDYSGSDAEVWVFYSGTSTILV